MSSKSKKNTMKFIKSNHIYIYASELSNLVGMNKFKKPAEVLLRIWKTNFAQEHSCILKELEERKNNNLNWWPLLEIWLLLRLHKSIRFIDERSY